MKKNSEQAKTIQVSISTDLEDPVLINFYLPLCFDEEDRFQDRQTLAVPIADLIAHLPYFDNLNFLESKLVALEETGGEFEEVPELAQAILAELAIISSKTENNHRAEYGFFRAINFVQRLLS